MKKGFRKGLVFFAAFVYLFFGILELDVFARAGGGRSSGSRGSRPSGPSRSYSAPSPSQPKSDPGSRSAQPQQNSPQLGTPYQQPSSGGFMRGLAGGLMGGFLGAMLFRSLGFAGTGGSFGSGIGFFEILLGAAILFGIYWFFKSRRRAAMARNKSSSKV